MGKVNDQIGANAIVFRCYRRTYKLFLGHYVDNGRVPGTLGLLGPRRMAAAHGRAFY